MISKGVRLLVLFLIDNIREIVWMTSWAALPSNLYISFGFVKHWGFISSICQTISTSFLSIKLYLVAKLSINAIALILISKIYCIVKKLLQNLSSDINDKETNKFLFLTLKKATFFLIVAVFANTFWDSCNFHFYKKVISSMTLFFSTRASALFYQTCLFFMWIL